MIYTIVPVKNEIQAVLNTIRVLGRRESKMDCIFIDGHSSDGSYEILQRECRNYDGFLVTRQKDLSEGKGGAVKEGIELIDNRSSTEDIIVLMDSDIENIKASWIDKLADPIKKNDVEITKGSFDYQGADFVTECIAKPLLSYLFPEIDFERPIEGEVAFKKSILEEIELGSSFYLESYFVIDVVMNDLNYKEVFLGKKIHAPREGEALKKLAIRVQKAILDKAIEYNRMH